MDKSITRAILGDQVAAEIENSERTRLRDYFAAAVIGDVYITVDGDVSHQTMAESAYKVADAMLTVRDAGLPVRPASDKPGPAGCLRDIADVAQSGQSLTLIQIALLRQIADDIDEGRCHD